MVERDNYEFTLTNAHSYATACMPLVFRVIDKVLNFACTLW